MCSVGKSDSFNKDLHAFIMIGLSVSTERSGCFGCLDCVSAAHDFRSRCNHVVLKPSSKSLFLLISSPVHPQLQTLFFH